MISTDIDANVIEDIIKGLSFKNIAIKYRITIKDVYLIYKTNLSSIASAMRFSNELSGSVDASVIIYARRWLQIRNVYEDLYEDTISTNPETRRFALKMLPVYLDKMAETLEQYKKADQQWLDYSSQRGGETFQSIYRTYREEALRKVKAKDMEEREKKDKEEREKNRSRYPYQGKLLDE